MASAEQLLKAVQVMEAQLEIVKRELNALGIKEEGTVGLFDGEAMVTEDGQRYIVPPNYASKSMLVAGDTLRMTDDPKGGDQPRFKQIAKVERAKSTGLLTRKDGKFEVICEEGSFKVLTAAVKHYEGEPGDQATIQFAKNHVKGSWAAVEKVIKAADQSTVAAPTPAAQPSSLSTGPAVISHAPQPIPEPQPTLATTSTPAPAPAVDLKPEPLVAATAQPAAATETESNKPRQSHRPDTNKARTKKPASSSRNKSKSSTTPTRTASQPSSPAAKATPAPQPAPADLPPTQGEISIPAAMDDDDLT